MALPVQSRRSDLVVCGLSGKRFSGVRELQEALRPLLLPTVTVVPKDGLCTKQSVQRYLEWGKAAFFIRVEAPQEVRVARGWELSTKCSCHRGLHPSPGPRD